MHPAPNRLGLGLRPMTPYGQGPPLSALMQPQQPPVMQPQKLTTLFVGSISAGITDAFLTTLLSSCGPLRSFKRLLTPIGKPQGFGFAEFEEPDALPRALELLNGVELPALEDGAPNKKLLIKADEKTRAFLDMFMAQRMKTDADDAQLQTSRMLISGLLDSLRNPASGNGGEANGSDKEKFIIPPHLHDLQEADLPENQRGLVISEIALFRERAARREKDKLLIERDRTAGVGPVNALAGLRGTPSAPSGPKERVWGRPQQQGGQKPGTPQKEQQGWGKTPQGPGKAPSFVKADEKDAILTENEKTDEDRDREGRQTKAREDERIFRERERDFEYRERIRIRDIERAIKDERRNLEHQERDRLEMKGRLEVWDDDESDEAFYTDRLRWRIRRAEALHRENLADAASREQEERQAEQLRRESEAFLARQMDEIKTLAVEQRKAGLLLDDGAPVKLNVSLSAATASTKTSATSAAAVDDKKESTKLAFGADEEEDEGLRKRRAPLIKLDFGVASDNSEKIKEKLEKMRAGVSKEKEVLWKTKVRWDAITDTLIDRKLEPIVKRKMTEYLGELDDDDLVMFVVEHLKDHKSASKLVEGLEPVLAEEAEQFTISLWRQIVFESVTYGEGLNTGSMLVD